MAQALATAADLPPEFSGTDAAVSAFWLDMTSSQIGLTAWGTDASRGHALLTAHHLKLAGEGSSSTAGTVSSRAVGSVSESYAVATPTDAELGSTVYGSMYLSLRRSRRPGPRAIRSNSAAVIPD